MKKTAIASVLALGLGFGAAQADPMSSATFTMLDGTGGTVGTDPTVTGAIGGGTWSVASTTPFFGLTWAAHSGTTFGPGTYTIDTVEGGTYTGVVVGAGQVGGHILFDWGVTTDIDVINVWDVTDNGDGTFTYTSTDVTATNPAGPDGIRGLGMIDGAFPGFNANFDFTAPDTVAPVITLGGGGASVTLGQGDAWTDPVSCSDAVDGAIAQGAGLTLGGDTVDTSTPGTYNLTYTCEDASGNIATDNRTVTVTAGGGGSVDTLPPVITLGGGGASVTLSQGDAWTDPVSCSDETDGAIAPGAGLTLDGDTVDTNTPGTYNLIYTCEDASGNIATDNRTVTVMAAGAPVITLLGANPLTVVPAASYTDPGATCTDPTDGDLTATGLSNDSATAVISDVVGRYTVTYTCTNTASTSATATRTVVVAGDTGDDTAVPTTSTGNNFTMLDLGAELVGGTNDVVFTWDGTFNTDVATATENATISSVTPFFGQLWTAHHVMIYAPGTYTIYTGCPAGDPGCGVGAPYNVTVADGQVMVHMLFDWGGTLDIDVIDVWETGTFGPSAMFVGDNTTTDPWSNDPATVWTFMSTDWDGDGINGAGMLDGPFIGFNANFNIMAVTGTGGGGTTNPAEPRIPGPVTIDDPSFGGGCTLAARPAPVAKAGDWLLVGLALAGLALFRRRAV